MVPRTPTRRRSPSADPTPLANSSASERASRTSEPRPGNSAPAGGTNSTCLESPPTPRERSATVSRRSPPQSSADRHPNASAPRNPKPPATSSDAPPGTPRVRPSAPLPVRYANPPPSQPGTPASTASSIASVRPHTTPFARRLRPFAPPVATARAASGRRAPAEPERSLPDKTPSRSEPKLSPAPRQTPRG